MEYYSAIKKNTFESIQTLGQEDSLEKGITTHSSILALENSMDRGAWWVTVQVVTKNQTRLSD